MYARQVPLELKPDSHMHYAEVTKVLSELIQGTPRVKTYEVANSTFHNIVETPRAA